MTPSPGRCISARHFRCKPPQTEKQKGPAHMQTANVNVPIKVTGRHVSVTEPIKDYAVSRIEHLHLDYPRIIEAHVILDVEKIRHFAEIILHCTNHITIESSHTTDDMYASIDGVV